MSVTPQTNTDLKGIAQAIGRYSSFAICGHVSPDGDCVGSALALALALEAIGKRAVCITAKTDPVDPTLAFLPGFEGFIPASQLEWQPEVFIGVDVPSRERIGEGVRVLDGAQLSITIDHHAYDTTMCDLVYVDPGAPATACLIWDLIPAMGVAPSAEMAQCAYTGLLTDTGAFCYQNADARAFAYAQSMVEAGASPADAAREVLENRSLASLVLEMLMLQRMEIIADGQAVLSYITQEDLDGLHASKADVEPLIDTLRTVRGVRIACLMREQDGAVRGSLRAKDATDVAVIARTHGGGGHIAAAGFTLACQLSEGLEILKDQISEQLSVQTGRIDTGRGGRPR